MVVWSIDTRGWAACASTLPTEAPTFGDYFDFFAQNARVVALFYCYHPVVFTVVFLLVPFASGAVTKCVERKLLK